MALNHAVDHGEAKPGATRALGREEELEAAASRRLIHARPCINDFHLHPVRVDQT